MPGTRHSYHRDTTALRVGLHGAYHRHGIASFLHHLRDFRTLSLWSLAIAICRHDQEVGTCGQAALLILQELPQLLNLSPATGYGAGIKYDGSAELTRQPGNQWPNELFLRSILNE